MVFGKEKPHTWARSDITCLLISFVIWPCFSAPGSIKNSFNSSKWRSISLEAPSWQQITTDFSPSCLRWDNKYGVTSEFWQTMCNFLIYLLFPTKDFPSLETITASGLMPFSPNDLITPNVLWWSHPITITLLIHYLWTLSPIFDFKYPKMVWDLLYSNNNNTPYSSNLLSIATGPLAFLIYFKISASLLINLINNSKTRKYK